MGKYVGFLLLFSLLMACGGSEEKGYKNIRDTVAEQQEITKREAAAKAAMPVEIPKEPQYRIAIGNQVYGPTNATTVLQWIRERRINDKTYCSKDKEPWQYLPAFPEFAGVLSQAVLTAASNPPRYQPPTYQSNLFESNETSKPKIPPLPPTRVISTWVNDD